MSDIVASCNKVTEYKSVLACINGTNVIDYGFEHIILLTEQSIYKSTFYFFFKKTYSLCNSYIFLIWKYIIVL